MFGRDIWRASNPTPLLKQGNLQPVVLDHVHMVLWNSALSSSIGFYILFFFFKFKVNNKSIYSKWAQRHPRSDFYDTYVQNYRIDFFIAAAKISSIYAG